MDAATLTQQVRRLRATLSTAALEGTAAGLIDLISSLEDLTSAARALQASASVAHDAARRTAQAEAGEPAARQGRGVAAEIALARKESPARGQVLLGLAKVLVAEMPHTLDRMRDGSLSEFRAILLARETACLERGQRAFVDAPIRHLDHIAPFERGGATDQDNGQGLCEACNHAKQAPGWEQQVVSMSRERPRVETITPSGHRYQATAPAPPGWREPRFVQAAPGRFVLTA